MIQPERASDLQNGCDWIVKMSEHGSMTDDELTEKIFKNHPFGFENFRTYYANASPLPLHYLKTLANTFLLVEPLAIVVAREIDFNDGWKNFFPIRGLRVTYVEEQDRSDLHRIFYEIACVQAAYMVGHSTDYSGHGRECHRHLDDMFAFLAFTYKLPIEKVTINYDQAADFLQQVAH